MSSNLTYRIATRPDYDNIMKFILEHTLKEEPTCASLQYTADESLPMWTEMVDECLQYAVSYLAFHADTLVAIRLCSVKAIGEATDDEDESHFSEKAQIVLKYLRAIDEASVPNIPLAEGKYLKVILTTVRPDYMRQGIASQLMKLCNKKSQEFGCHGVYTQAVAFKSQQMYVKNNWKLLGEVLHADLLNSKGEREITCPPELKTDRGQGLWMQFPQE